MKQSVMPRIAALSLVAAVLIVVAAAGWPVFARWRENQRRAAVFANLKQVTLSSLQYRIDAPPLLIKHHPNGTKDYYWLVEGQEIYKRTERPPHR